MVLGLAVFGMAVLGAVRGQEPFATWFFAFAWWSYILFVDGWVYRHRKESLLLSYPARFAFLAGWSVVFWLFFEALNLRLGNWSYWDLPADRAVRWAGYALAFSTVIPGLLETADLVDSAGVIGEGKVKPLGWKKRMEGSFIAAGLGMLVLPLLWPQYFFPLVWGSLIFLLEPLNERMGASSLLADWRMGRMKRLFTLLAAGLLCGGLWEWWNSLARARWSYSIPGMETKIFEMPILGYLGFAPFAVEVFAAASWASALWERTSTPVKSVLAAAAAAFALAMFAAIDASTVKSFHG
jgi:hypothetical protein